mgnify:CR=1 FL=1
MDKIAEELANGLHIFRSFFFLHFLLCLLKLGRKFAHFIRCFFLRVGCFFRSAFILALTSFALLLLTVVPVTIVQPLVDSEPGGGLWLFGATLLAFVAVAAWAVWGPDRGTPDGAGEAILDLRLAFATRLAIHLVFLVALLWLGVTGGARVLLLVALLMLFAELPLGMIVNGRRRAAPGSASPSPLAAAPPE